MYIYIHTHLWLYSSWKCKRQTFGGGEKKEKKKGAGQRMSVKYSLYQLDQEPDQSTYDVYSAYCKVSVTL